MAVANAGVKIDARAHRILTGQLDLMDMTVIALGTTTDVIDVAVAVLRADGPGIDSVGHAATGDPHIATGVGEVAGRGHFEVLHVLKRTTDRELTEGQVQAGLVERLLMAVRAIGVERPGTAAAPGNAEAIEIMIERGVGVDDLLLIALGVPVHRGMAVTIFM